MNYFHNKNIRQIACPNGARFYEKQSTRAFSIKMPKLEAIEATFYNIVVKIILWLTHQFPS